MADVETAFHTAWLGMVQPVEGLVVSLPVLLEAQCFARHPPALQRRFGELAPPEVVRGEGEGQRAIADLKAFFGEMLGLTPDLFDEREALADDLSLYVPEGQQTVRPTLALKRQAPSSSQKGSGSADDSTPQSRAGEPYVALVWQLPQGLPLDEPETTTGSWNYPAGAKFDRLLRACRVSIGLLSNGETIRLVYAPHGESSGSISFSVDAMASVGGRPVFDAFITLLHARRWFDVAEEHRLPAILRASRQRQANVTNALAAQVFDALGALVAGFEAAAERDGRANLDAALARDEGHLYAGLLTVLLRLVFLLYAEDKGLLPIDQPLYAENFSVLGLFDELQRDHAAYPDSMARRFGAWPRLVALFRAVYAGTEHVDLKLPPRRGQLFDPNMYPFLEGWGPEGSAPVKRADERGRVRVPTVDDGTVFTVLSKLLVLDGQRLSYRALDVEQLGSVYEALIGYRVVRVAGDALCLKPDKVWVTGEELLAVAPGRRAAYLEEHASVAKTALAGVTAALSKSKTPDEILAAIEPLAHKAERKEVKRVRAGRLAVQPGKERRRTSSHYTPRSLSEPIVRKTLEPLLRAMGDPPSSVRLLELKICDPAMGSGAFLVEACRFLADQLVAAWTREGELSKVASAHEDVVNHARRLVAQRCLYGVDKNPFAVNLAKLSLWLVTLAKNEPFTFVDHALRHGDSLVGVSLEQIRTFHWKPPIQLDLFGAEIDTALDEAITLRQRILDSAEQPGQSHKKEHLLWDAEDALRRVRLIGDLLVGAFWAHDSDREREKERVRRLDRVRAWLHEGGDAPVDLFSMQAEVQAKTTPFHWMSEFAEVFYLRRPDPLEGDKATGAAFMDAFVGNPPFLGGKRIRSELGNANTEWLGNTQGGSLNADLSARFFCQASKLLGHNGSIGFIATNSIAQGDTRVTGLQAAVREGALIHDARRSLPWPGEANVAVSIVHIAKGTITRHVTSLTLDEVRVCAINSRLRPTPERPDPMPLGANDGKSFVGSYVLGMGFVLTPEERDRLTLKDQRNAERIFPYIGGEEINTSPTQAFERYVINFGQMTLQESERWPHLMAIVRDKVKPERDRLSNNPDGKRYKEHWWQFGRSTPAREAATQSLRRVLVNSQVSKHLMFSFQERNKVFSHTVYVYPLEAFSFFSLLQSRIHEPWARLLSSSMRNDMRYAASDCFDTFPFPRDEHLRADGAPEAAGQHLYDTRAKYMVDENVGLTITYNRLKDPSCRDVRIVELRRLHEEVDRAVLAAYDWSDLAVPPYSAPVSEGEKRQLAAFEDEVIDRLFALNAKRAEEERLMGLGVKAAKVKGGPRKVMPGKAPAPAADLPLVATAGRRGSSSPSTEAPRLAKTRPAASQGASRPPDSPSNRKVS